MPGKRSRQGCDECRRRRRKCDEQKPTCAQCSAFGRTCHYTLKLVWGGRRFRKSCFGQCLQLDAASAETIDAEDGGFVYGTKGLPQVPLSQQEQEEQALLPSPQCLPNGVPLPPRYQTLLSYFTEGILASLSCHPSIHEDLCRGLIPVALDSPHLLSACLALSAAGFLSRGLSDVDGINISRVLGHLQTSGLSLLRTALESGHMDESLLATCLIWCLADVFACRQGVVSSWRIHLQGIKALIDGNQTFRNFGAGSGTAVHTAMRHLHLLYLSLQTLPYVPSPDSSSTKPSPVSSRSILPPPREPEKWPAAASQSIDGFLGYSEELLHVLQQIDQISHNYGGDDHASDSSSAQADMLLGKVRGMIRRDSSVPPSINTISSSLLTTEHGRDFSLCHRSFQQATLVHLYRRLYRLPSGSDPIQAAVREIENLVGEMTQGQPCRTWVAMAMPLFTIGCEAFTEEQRGFVLDKVDKLEACLGSLHVRVIRQALRDMWRTRSELGDVDGEVCASELLDGLKYNIILF